WTGTNSFSNPISGSVTGTASTITGNVGENQVTGLTSDLNTLNTAIAGETTRAMTAEGNLSSAITAETTRATAAENGKANLAGGNMFTGGAQKLAPSATGYASLNVPDTGAVPSNPALGDIWLLNNDTHLQFEDKNSATQSLAFLSDITSANSSLLGANNSWTGTNTFNNPISGSVTGTASTITGSVSENQVTGLTSDLNTLNTAIAGETTRAMTAEGNLSSAITAE